MYNAHPHLSTSSHVYCASAFPHQKSGQKKKKQKPHYAQQYTVSLLFSKIGDVAVRRIPGNKAAFLFLCSLCGRPAPETGPLVFCSSFIDWNATCEGQFPGVYCPLELSDYNAFPEGKPAARPQRLALVPGKPQVECVAFRLRLQEIVPYMKLDTVDTTLY